MIELNGVFWQGIIFMFWGYVLCHLLNAFFGFPRRLLEEL